MTKRLLVLIGSPRRDGNTAALADAVRRGAETVGTQATVRFLDDHITGFLRDCRSCRGPDGECTIPDRYRSLLFDDFLPADGVAFCSPIYWYGLSAQTKAFLDRTFCYYAKLHPRSAEVARGMMGKRIGLILASEESYPGAALGIVHQMQEFARYTGSDLVDVVRGIGNARGEVIDDPRAPVAAAEGLGATIFTARYTDYRLDTERSSRIWVTPEPALA